MSNQKNTKEINLTVNGKSYTFEVEPKMTLMELLREKLKFGGTKEGCSVGKCGTCAVIIDGKTVTSCLVLAVDANGKNVVTTEGLAGEAEFHPFHEAFTPEGVMRASSVTPGLKKRQEVFTFCHVCCGHCSIKATIEDGKVVDIAPDMESGFPNELCPVKKSRIQIPETLQHPDRLKYPLKRVGEKGEGKWERISWDEAINMIVTKFKDIRDNFGPEYVAMCLGEPKGMEYGFGQRFASAFGTPNVFTPSWSCGIPNSGPANDTCGSNCVVDEIYLPKLLVDWGLNINHMSWGIRRDRVTQGLKDGMKLIVVDPRAIDLTEVADMWIKLRPGSDGALAMGLLKVMIEEKLYDKDVAENWTVGFDKLVEEVKSFTLEDVERVTWVPKQQIVDFARMYGTIKPAAIQWGNALDQNPTQYQGNRAIMILRALSGNLNVKGGDVFLSRPAWLRPGKFYFPKGHTRTTEKVLGQEFAVPMKTAYVPAPAMIKSLLTGNPYRLKAAWCILTNPVISYPKSDAVYEAFKQLEFLVVNEIFMTPTAMLADLVLPACWGMEHDELGYWPGWQKQLRAHPKLVEPQGEAWPDSKIVNEVAKGLGLGHFFWEDYKDALNEMLVPSGMDFKEFAETKRQLLPPHEYRVHQYNTPSGKIEIYSNKLEEMGLDPMPTWKWLSTLSEPNEEFPLLLSNYKEDAFLLSAYRHIVGLRAIRPNPTVEMNPEDARKYGVEEGDWVTIETAHGKCTQKLTITPKLSPGIVLATFGWWFPEDGIEKEYGWKRGNINMVIECENVSKECGSPWMRGLPCRVYKAAGPDG